MVIQSPFPVPVTNLELHPSNLYLDQTMPDSTFKMARSNDKELGLPFTDHDIFEFENISANIHDPHSANSSGNNPTVDFLRLSRFENSLGFLERMLGLRQKLDHYPLKDFDDIIRKQINILTAIEFQRPSTQREYFESSAFKHLERLAEFRQSILSQWHPTDRNGWTGDVAKSIDHVMGDPMRTMAVKSYTVLSHDVDALVALESLAKVRKVLYDKHGLEKLADVLIGQKIRALSAEQFVEVSSGGNIPGVRTPDAESKGDFSEMMVDGNGNTEADGAPEGGQEESLVALEEAYHKACTGRKPLLLSLITNPKS